MRAIEELVSKLAPTNIPLLLVGENGTGKEILAHQIHQLSLKSGQSFVKVVCAFLSSESLSAHFKGSNNGTEEAGTLFFREISELDQISQRTLQYSLPQEEFTATQNFSGPRFIASTTRNLEEEVKAGVFRADLYYQITAASIALLPLRRRTEDIPGVCGIISAETFNSSWPSTSAPGFAGFRYSAETFLAG